MFVLSLLMMITRTINTVTAADSFNYILRVFVKTLQETKCEEDKNYVRNINRIFTAHFISDHEHKTIVLDLYSWEIDAIRFPDLCDSYFYHMTSLLFRG